MTKIHSDKPLTRETSTTYKGKPLCLELHQGYLVIHPKGSQEKYMVDYTSIFHLGAKNNANS